MFRRNTLAILFACSTFAALPAFSQDEVYRQEVSGQVFGSLSRKQRKTALSRRPRIVEVVWRVIDTSLISTTVLRPTMATR